MSRIKWIFPMINIKEEVNYIEDPKIATTKEDRER
jgi:hypothetical protein